MQAHTPGLTGYTQVSRYGANDRITHSRIFALPSILAGAPTDNTKASVVGVNFRFMAVSNQDLNRRRKVLECNQLIRTLHVQASSDTRKSNTMW